MGHENLCFVSGYPNDCFAAVKRSRGLHVRMNPVRKAWPHSFVRFLAACSLAFLATGCVPRDVSQYVGKDPYIVFPTDQVVDQSLMQPDESHPGADWGLSLVWEGDHYLLTADQNVTPGGLQQSWRVRAVQRIPLLKYNQILAMGTCKDGSGSLSRVVAVVNYDHTKQWFDDIDSAWAFDPAQGAFVDYPLQGLKCENRLYGTDLSPPPPLFLAPATNTAPAAATAQAPKPPSR